MKLTKEEVKERMIRLEEYKSFEFFVVNTQEDCVLRIKVTFDGDEFKIKEVINNETLSVAELGQLCADQFVTDNSNEAQQFRKEMKEKMEKEFKKELLADF